MRNGGSVLFNEEKSESQSDVLDERNVSNGDFIASQIGGLFELGFNDSQGLKVFLLSGFVVFFGDSVESEDGVGGPEVSGSKLTVAELEPLVDGGGFSRGVSVEFASFEGKVPEDGIGLVDVSFRGLEDWDFSEGMFGEVFGRFDFVPSDSFEGDWDVNESGEEINFLSSGGLVLRGVEFVAHC
jgi:hypothetical protein